MVEIFVSLSRTNKEKDPPGVSGRKSQIAFKEPTGQFLQSPWRTVGPGDSKHPSLGAPVAPGSSFSHVLNLCSLLGRSFLFLVMKQRIQSHRLGGAGGHRPSGAPAPRVKITKSQGRICHSQRATGLCTTRNCHPLANFNLKNKSSFHACVCFEVTLPYPSTMEKWKG